MRAADVLTLGASSGQRFGNTLTALLTVAVTVAVAVAADAWLRHRSARGALSPEIGTRLLFLRRLVTLAIVLLGGSFALSKVGVLHQLATGLFASTAIVAAVVGFAARQVLANLVAGVMLTITQPLRIGDQVAVGDDSGTVEDVRLNYTVIKGADGGRLFIPNERLAASVLRNDTIIDAAARPEVSLWLAPGGDAGQALDVLAGEDPSWSVRLAEVTAEGIRIAVAGTPTAVDLPGVESAMRRQGLDALRGAGLL